MRSRHSRSARLVMVLTSLVTVWCLGCSAFEPLVDALLGRTGVMTCAGQEMAGAAAANTADAGAADGLAIRHVSAPVNQRQGFDCGCGGSCHAPRAGVSRTATGHTRPASIAVVDALQPPSADRVPLLPPPERVA
jgi:hypothetical protein